MSIECAECERDIRAGHTEHCSKFRAHTGTHPITERTCDDPFCWCHARWCAAKRTRNGQHCNCGWEE